MFHQLSDPSNGASKGGDIGYIEVWLLRVTYGSDSLRNTMARLNHRRVQQREFIGRSVVPRRHEPFIMRHFDQRSIVELTMSPVHVRALSIQQLVHKTTKCPARRLLSLDIPLPAFPTSKLGSMNEELSDTRELT